MPDDRELYEVTWLGYNEATNYDQIWGFVTMADKRIFTFWGKRGGRILFKKQGYHMRAQSLIRQQESKGFTKIRPAHYEKFCPDFQSDLEISLMTAILTED